MNTEVLEAERFGYSDYQLTIDKILRYGLFIAPDQKIVGGLPPRLRGKAGNAGGFKRRGKIAEEELKDYLMVNYVNTGIMPKYWVPDKILFFEHELPKTSTGKINKVFLRDKYKDAGF